ncbi:hypothetical protein L596_015595 [Steinernema carpocapsae]|uniref:Uncharacterized protein n=1 Tax=Steinernema carpocapsae TaxID=34508 RepID=A0A4U5NGC6_STECR|nr:hypothetical protein L596_015595 [Steinernema carpocapsae]
MAIPKALETSLVSLTRASHAIASFPSTPPTWWSMDAARSTWTTFRNPVRCRRQIHRKTLAGTRRSTTVRRGNCAAAWAKCATCLPRFRRSFLERQPLRRT